MNHVRWVAWGVIDLEKLERMQRRNYIKKIREDVTPLGIVFEPGGVKATPWYRVTLPIALKGAEKQHAVAGADAARKVCQWLLMEIEAHEPAKLGQVGEVVAE